MDLQTLKEVLKNNCEKYFQEKPFNGMPIYKLFSVIALAGSDLDSLKSSIIEENLNNQTVQSEIEALTSTDVLTNFRTDSDDNMKSYVLQYFPNLTNDAQKIAVIISLQRIS